MSRLVSYLGTYLTYLTFDYTVTPVKQQHSNLAKRPRPGRWKNVILDPWCVSPTSVPPPGLAALRYHSIKRCMSLAVVTGHWSLASTVHEPHDRIVCVNSCLTRPAQRRDRAGILSASTLPLSRLAMTNHPGTLALPEERQRRLEGNISRSGYHVGGTGFASSAMQCATEGRGICRMI